MWFILVHGHCLHQESKVSFRKKAERSMTLDSTQAICSFSVFLLLLALS